MSKWRKIEEFLRIKGEPEYRFKQICQAVFNQKIDDFEKITTIPKHLRLELKREFGDICNLKVLKTSKDKNVEKILFKLQDGKTIESVWMDYRDWESVCVSTQVGCALNCQFCATGKAGFKRNLTADEIIDQVLYFFLKRRKVHSVSLMGMGEPLLNFDNTIEAIKVLTDKRFFGFSPRKINLSTIGILPQLEKFLKIFPNVNLALSLHSPFEKQREELMPATKKTAIDEIFKVLDNHIKKNKRKVFLPYIMLDGINDSENHLRSLIALIRKRGKFAYLYHLNLIRYNQVSEIKNQFNPSSPKTIEFFRINLERAGINVTIRQSFGEKIEAGCGQLRNRRN